MAKIVPVDHEHHGGKRWRHPSGYSFAGAETLVPLAASEFAEALSSLPIGFVLRSGQYVAVAILGLEKGTNLFVGPDGQWFGHYVPAALRGYPFSLVRAEGSEQPTLCVDEDSGLVVDEDGENIEKFFEADGMPAAATVRATEFLRQLEREYATTNRAVAALAEAGVIMPWALTVPVGDRQIVVNGLHRVDEAAVNALEDGKFLELRKGSALIIGYWQIASIIHLNLLARLTLVRQQAQARATGTIPT
jgi:hypothetical protein